MKKLMAFLVAFLFLLSPAIVFSKNMQQYDYVIITTDELASALNNFTQWKESMGYSVKIVTTSWIESNFEGKDLPEKIRNFLIDRYEQWGIDYVLIVGSRDKIPMRECYPVAKYHVKDYMVPTDYYYADLTGNWDADNDGYFGEIIQDKPDFYPEVYVGRIPADKANKVATICQHIINFEKSNETWKKNVLLAGAIIFYENYTNVWGTFPRIDTATLMEKCWDDIFKPNGFNATKLYEKEGIKPSIYSCDYPLNHSNVLAHWKEHGIVNIVGHSTSLGVYRCIWANDNGDNIPQYNELSFYSFIESADRNDLSASLSPIVFSGGCSQLERAHNMGRTFLENGDATAFIGATAVSWNNITLKWNDEKDGGVLSLDYFFFHYLVNKGQKLGNALYNAKSYYYNHFGFGKNVSNLRIWAFYSNLFSFNLYGDPSMGLSNEKIDANPPSVEIQQPENGIYIFGNKIIPFFMPLIIGSVDVKAIANDENGIEKVEFYLDNHLETSIENQPYEWKCNAIGMHKIKVVAIDSHANIGGDEIEVFGI